MPCASDLGEEAAALRLCVTSIEALLDVVRSNVEAAESLLGCPCGRPQLQAIDWCLEQILALADRIGETLPAGPDPAPGNDPRSALARRRG